MRFNLSAARKAGKTDSEIADYLGKEFGFDVAAARGAGKTDTEIAEYLSTKTKPSRDPAADKAVGDRLKARIQPARKSMALGSLELMQETVQDGLDPESRAILAEKGFAAASQDVMHEKPKRDAKRAEQRAIFDRKNEEARKGEGRQEARTDSEILNDSQLAVRQGLLGLNAGVSFLVGKLPGIQTDGFTAAMLEERDRLGEQKSGFLKQAKGDIEAAEGFAGTMSAIIDNPVAVPDIIFENITSVIPGMATGRLAAGTAGKMATRKAAESGATRAAAVAAGQQAAGRAAAAGGLAGEALHSGGLAGADAEREVKGMDVEKLAEVSGRFRELSTKMSPEQAREQLADEVGLTTAALAGAGTLAGGYVASKINKLSGLGDPYAEALVKRITARGAAKTVAGEVVQESLQSPAEQIGQNLANVDDSTAWNEDVGKATALGAVGAIGQSAGMTAGGAALNAARGGVEGQIQREAERAASGAEFAVPADAVARDAMRPENAQWRAEDMQPERQPSPAPEADLRAKAADSAARSQEAAAMADEARAMGNAELAAQLEAESVAAAAEARQALDTIKTEHTGLKGIVNRSGLAAGYGLQQSGFASPVQASNIDIGMPPAAAGLGDAANAPSPTEVPAPAAEGAADAGQVIENKGRSVDASQPVADIKTAGDQWLHSRMSYLRGQLQVSRDPDFVAATKAELKAVSGEINARRAAKMATPQEEKPAAAVEPMAPAADTAPSVNYPNRKLGWSKAKSDPDFPQDTGALANIAMANLQPGDRVRVADGFLTVKTIGEKSVVFTKPDGKTTRYDIDTPRMEQLTRDVEGLITAAQHGAEVGDVMKALERDPAFSRDERGVPQLLDAVAAPAPAARGDDRRKVAGKKDPEPRTEGRRQSDEAVADDRRRGPRRVDDMTPEEMRQALLINPLTGLPNKRAFEEDADLGWPHVAAMDIDGFGFLNDIWGHDPVDAILKQIGAKMAGFSTDTVRLYHRSGDEFAARSNDKEALRLVLKSLQDHFEASTFTVDGVGKDGRPLKFIKHGIGVTFGISTDYQRADNEANADKERRLAAGQRGAKGTNPGGMVEVDAEGVQADLGKRGLSRQETERLRNRGSEGGLDPEQEAANKDAPVSQVVLQNRNRSDAAYVQQMTQISANPDATRLGFSRDFSAGAPVILADGIPSSQMGRVDRAATGAGRQIRVQYAVVEADELLASNAADGTKVPGYDTGIAGKSRTVAGNGRVAGIKSAYQKGTADKYREDIAGDEALHGVSASVIRGMKAPILVRIMSPADVTANIGDESNDSGVSQKSAIEHAKDDARRIDVAGLEFGEDGEVTKATMRQFVASMPVSEQTGMLTAGGEPTTQATNRLMGAIFWQAYQSEGLTELFSQATDPEARTVLQGLAIAAPAMARLKDIAGHDLDIRDLITEAAVAAVNARRRNIKLSEYVNQLDLDASPEIAPILRMFAENIRSSKKIGEALQGAAEYSYDEATRDTSGGMFGDAVSAATRNQVLGKIHDTARQENLGQQGRAGADGGDAQGQAANTRAEGGRAEAEGNQQERLSAPDSRDFSLSTYTEADLAERDRIQQEAEARNDEDETRRTADAASDAFTLSTGTGTGTAGTQLAPAVRGPARDMFAPSRPQDGIEELRRNLIDLENKIVGMAGMAPGFIEDAMKSRKVPSALKQQRNELRDRLRGLRAAQVPPSASQPMPSDEELALASRHKKIDKSLDLKSDAEIADIFERAGLAGRNFTIDQKRDALKQEHPDDVEPLLGIGAVDAGPSAAAKPEKKPASKTPIIERYNALVKRWNDLASRYSAADDQGKAAIKQAMDLLDAEMKAARGDILLDGKRQAAEAQARYRDQLQQELAAMPVGARMRPSEFGADAGIFWEKTGDNEWTARGDWFQKGQTRTNAELAEGGGLVEMPAAAAPSSDDNVGTKPKQEQADPFAGNRLFTSDKVAAAPTSAIDRHNSLMEAVRDGKASPEQFKAAFDALIENRDAVIAELYTKTKAQLLEDGGHWIQMRYRNKTKPDIVKAIYRDLLADFALGESITYGMSSGSYEDAIKAKVDAVDAAKLADYARERKASIEEAAAAREAAEKAIEDPKTVEDFQRFIQAKAREGKAKTFNEARMLLTPEQRIRFDELVAESTREDREQRKRSLKTQVKAAGQTTDGQIIATKHTRDGYDLFVVQLADRLSKEDYTTVLASAKRLGGWYSSFRGNGATPGFQFKDKASAEAFLKLAGGDTTDAQAQAEQRRDAFEDDRSQTAVERLREMADRLDERADESLAVDRKVNTARRARFAASAERAANADKALAKTMRNIADGIESGTVKFIDEVRQKTQVELLRAFVVTAKDNELRAKYPEYGDREKRKGQPPTAETADYAEFPSFTASRSDLASLARQLLEVEGTKKLGKSLMDVADDVSDAYLAFAKKPENLQRLSTFSIRAGEDVRAAVFPSRDTAEQAIKRSGLVGKAIVLPVKRGENRIILSPSEAINQRLWDGESDKRITLKRKFGMELVAAISRRANKTNRLTVPWQFENAAARLNALSRLGIETPAELRSALREFIGLQEQAKELDRVKQMEREMVGRRADGLDFFPTPEGVADQMIEAAEIEPGMRVLEPSAGMGHIADRIREAGIDPDVVEFSPERRELLEAKGHHIVGQDFMDLSRTDAPVVTRQELVDIEQFLGAVRGDVLSSVRGALSFYDRGDYAGAAMLMDRATRQAEFNESALQKFGDIVERLKAAAEGKYDRIIMNPPFSNRRDAEHVRHAFELLRPGGRLVAIMGEGVFFGQDKKAADFREWLEQVGGTDEKLPEGSFMDPSLPVNTGVSARMVVIDKPAVPGVSYSIGQAAAGMNPAKVERLLRAGAVGKGVAALLDSGKVVIHASAPEGIDPRAEGWTDRADGSVHLLAPNLSAKSALPVLMHELFHKGMRQIGGTAQHKRLMRELAALYRQYERSPAGTATNAFWRSAMDRVQSAQTPDADRVEEFGAYAITAFESAPRSLRKWVTAFAGQMKAWLLRSYGIQLGSVTPAQLRAVALHALKPEAVAAVSGVGPVYSGADDMAFAAEIAQELAESDELFRYPVSQERTLPAVMADVFPEARYLGDDTREDERKESGADKRHLFRTEQGKDFYVYERGRDVWIDVSRLEEGQMGSGIYAAVGNYAHNAGRTFIGDPAGLSEAAVVRRTSAMLSLALRFGRTDFMEPAAEQLAGAPTKGIAPLKWQGDDAAKTRALIETFLGTLDNQFPQLKSYRYDFSRRQFVDRSGRPVGPDRFADAGRSPVARAARASSATARRGIFLQSLVSSEGSQRPGILEQALNGRRSLIQGGELDGLFSKPVDQTNTPEFKRWFGDSKVVDSSGRPLVVYHGTPDGRFLEQDGVFKSQKERYGQGSALGVHWFASDQRASRTYMDPKRAFDYQNAEPAMVPAYLRMTNPLVIDAGGQKWRDAQKHGKTGDVIRQAQDAGHDGIIIRNVRDDYQTGVVKGDKPTDTYAVFDSAQIKSATGNKGTFDPNNPSIFYSKTDTVGDTFKLPPARWLVTKFFDRFDRIKQVQKAVQEQGGKVTDLSDIYGQEEAYHSRAASFIDRFRRHRVGGLLKRMVRAGVRIEDVGLFLYAQHAPERNAQIAKLYEPGGQLSLDGTGNDRMQDGGSGMTNAEAAEILAEFEAKGLTKKLDTFARELREITADTRKILRESGLETGEAIDAWEAAYKFYVPLAGKDEANSARSVIVGRGFDVRGGQKRAMGRRDKAKHIIEQIILQHEQAVIRAEKNLVGKRLLQFVKQNPDGRLWEVNPTEQRRYISADGTVEYREQPLRTDRNVVAVRINGADTFILLADQGMADAIHNVGTEDVGFLLRALGAVSRFTSKMFTAFSPAFIAVNAIRDLQTALLHGYQVGGAKYARQIMRNIPKAYAELISDVRDGDSQLVKLYEQSGGRTGMVFMIKDFEEKHQEVMRQMAALKGVSLAEIGQAFEAGYKDGFAAVGRKVRYNKFTNLFRAFLEAVEVVNGVVENGVRLAAFKAAMDEGKPAREAGSIAKNLTVNFNRKGELAPTLGALYIFFNASVQGTVRMAQALQSRKLQAVAAGMFMASFLLAALQMDADEDDDGRADLEQVPAWQRGRNLIFMGEDGAYGKMPLPLGWNVFSMLGTEAAIMTMSKSREAYAAGAWNMLRGTVEMFNPVGDFTPSVMTPFFQIARNETAFGGPIYPDYKKDGPASQQFYDATEGSVYERATRLANEATGGNEFRAGLVDINPEKLEHVVEFFGGGALRFLTDTVDTVSAAADGGPAQPADKLPIVRAFYGKLRDEYQTSRFYENERKVSAIKEEVEGLQKAQRFDEAGAIMERNPAVLGLDAQASSTRKVLKAIKSQEQLIRGDESLGEGEKRRQLQELREQRGQVVKPFNAAYEESVRK